MDRDQIRFAADLEDVLAAGAGTPLKKTGFRVVQAYADDSTEEKQLSPVATKLGDLIVVFRKAENL